MPSHVSLKAHGQELPTSFATCNITGLYVGTPMCCGLLRYLSLVCDRTNGPQRANLQLLNPNFPMQPRTPGHLISLICQPRTSRFRLEVEAWVPSLSVSPGLKLEPQQGRLSSL